MEYCVKKKRPPAHQICGRPTPEKKEKGVKERVKKSVCSSRRFPTGKYSIPQRAAKCVNRFLTACERFLKKRKLLNAG